MASLTEKEVKVKISQRGTVRACVTKSVQSVNVALSAVPQDIEKAKKAVALLRNYQEKLVVLDGGVLLHVDDEKLGEEVERAQEYQDRIVTTIEEVDQCVSALLLASQPRPPNSQHSRDTAPKLPKLEIEKFRGDPLLWEQFWDNFEACIHNRSDLPVIDKFKYLKSFLDGEALRMADGYRLTVANYDEVLQALKERFGDPEMAIFAHFEALIALTPASYNLAELRGILDSCESHIRSLVALGLPESTFGVVFTPLILSKLPKHVKMELYRKNGSQKWTLANLRTLLKEEISAREKCERVFAGKIETPPEKTPLFKSKLPISSNSRKPTTTSSLLTLPEKSKSKRPVPDCAFCGKKHYSGECRIYPDLNSRRKQLQDRCFCCLRKGHSAKECRSKKPCFFCKRETHHQSFCPKQYGNRSDEREESMVASTADNMPASSTHKSAVCSAETNLSLQSPNSKAILQTAIAEVKWGSGQTKARLYFDTGGSRSFISLATAKKIGANLVGEESVSVGRFRDSHHSTVMYQIYEFDICLPNGKSVTVRMSGEQSISCPIQLVPIDFSVRANVKLAEPTVSKATLVPIDILVGNDYYYTFIGQHQMRCSNGVVLLESPFGFVTGGSLMTKNKAEGFESSLFLHASTYSGNDTGIERFWSLEQIGIKDDPHKTDDELALNSFNASVAVEDGRYIGRWPWKDKNPQLDSNYALAHGRLKSLLKRMTNEKDVLQKYDDTISDQLKKGIIEVAPKHPDGPEHYLPHHCVITPTKTTTKLRVVYDASAKPSKDQPSLNECLHRGPVFLADLVGILIRWRLSKVAFISDIEKAFLQVGLQQTDRDITRFLWLKTISQPFSAHNLQIYRFCRVPFGVISSPFLLAATLAHHLKQSGGQVASSIQRNTYVDNVFGGATDDESALDYYRKAKGLLTGAKMNLREWFSNSPTFVEKLDPADRGNGQETSVLGLRWDTATDQFSIPAARLLANQSTHWTKRSVLRALASVFDPCGLFSPVTTSAKVLMQQLWKHKCEWDDALPQDLDATWKSTLENLSEIPAIPIARQLSVSVGDQRNLELHCFCDASRSAYASAVYLRSQQSDAIVVDLVFAKSRVSPVKPISIPRLELLAVFIGVRALDFVRRELDVEITDSFIWTDSKCTLSWIANNVVSTTFVKNRIKEIRKYADIKFGYVPGSQNPADLPSRGVSCNEIKNSQLWWHGPAWLRQNPNDWPEQEACLQTDQAANVTAITHIANVRKPDYKKEDYLLDVTRCGCLRRLYRITAYCFRFVRATKRDKNPDTLTISAAEMATARDYWETKVQTCCCRHLVSSKTDRNIANLRRQFGLFEDSHRLIRCRGRYLGDSAKVNADCPILLPKGHPYTDLVIMDSHINTMHSGVKHTLAEVRKRHWIIHSRNQIKRVLKSCRICKFYDGRPFRTPDPGSLPECRLSRTKPFDVVGIDYLGPLMIKPPETTALVKVWVCLFTCATVRAVHLELIPDLTTEQFLLCYRRFVASYGRPRLVISDNAKCFHSANRTLSRIWREILRSDAVQELSTKQQTSWKFIIELSPWMGGFYERIVGLVKTALKKSVHNRCLTFLELQTLLCEICSVLNTRPLLYSEESTEQDYLSPSHFLSKSPDNLPTVHLGDDYTPQPVSADHLIAKWRRIQRMLDEFWKTWRTSYLQSLQQYAWQPKNRNTSQALPMIGNVVIIKDVATRGCWKLGIITELIKSHDGVVRSAVLRTSTGTVLRRPLNLLTPLECSITGPTGYNRSTSSDSQTARTLSSRTASWRARKRLKEQLRAEREDEDDNERNDGATAN